VNVRRPRSLPPPAFSLAGKTCGMSDRIDRLRPRILIKNARPWCDLGGGAFCPLSGRREGPLVESDHPAVRKVTARPDIFRVTSRLMAR